VTPPAPPAAPRRRLTPNFKVRVEVQYRNRVSFPLSLKAYIITQQEKDSLQDWVPDEYLETEFPQVRGPGARRPAARTWRLAPAQLAGACSRAARPAADAARRPACRRSASP
jgi:hypothetical protein